jgi:very-short-patch-repair endonuclease
MNKHDPPLHISLARDLRKNQTPSEAIMWEMLRARKFMGLKFLRQHPFVINQMNGKNSFYIADFYCAEKKFVLEIDGLIHNFQTEYDQTRDENIAELGLTILRITNEEIEKDVYEVLDKIKQFL